MVYSTNCTGTPQLDQSSTLEEAAGFSMIGTNNARAQKIVLTSKCLESVTLKLLRNMNGANASVRICNDLSGFPDFTSNLGEFTRTSEEISSLAFTEINFPLNIELSNTNPVWIVVTSNYDPNSETPDSLISIAGIQQDSTDKFALKIGNDNWIYDIGKPYFKTFKQTEGTTSGWDLVVTEKSDSFSFKTCSPSEGGYFYVLTPSNKELGKVDIVKGDCSNTDINKSYFTETGTYKAIVSNYSNATMLEKSFNYTPSTEESKDNTLIYLAAGVGVLYLITRKK